MTIHPHVKKYIEEARAEDTGEPFRGILIGTALCLPFWALVLWWLA